MKNIIEIIETGQWAKHPQVARLTIEQVNNMRQTIIEFEELGINQALFKQTIN